MSRSKPCVPHMLTSAWPAGATGAKSFKEAVRMTAEVSPCQLVPAETPAFCRVAPMVCRGGATWVGRGGRERQGEATADVGNG